MLTGLGEVYAISRTVNLGAPDSWATVRTYLQSCVCIVPPERRVNASYDVHVIFSHDLQPSQAFPDPSSLQTRPQFLAYPL